MEAIFKICKLANFPKVDFLRFSLVFGVIWDPYNEFKTNNFAVIQNVRVHPRSCHFYWPIVHS